MNVLEPVMSRRSIRKYKTVLVEDEKVMTLLESARLAPSGNNTQLWDFIVVRADEVKQQIVTACHNQTWMLNAPVFIVCVADARSRFPDRGNLVIDENSPEPAVKKIIRDAAIAIEHLVLQAEALGLATCWVAYFEQNGIRPVLNIPADKYVVAVIPVGYASENPLARPRKSLQEIVHYETWGNKREE